MVRHTGSKGFPALPKQGAQATYNLAERNCSASGVRSTHDPCCAQARINRCFEEGVLWCLLTISVATDKNNLVTNVPRDGCNGVPDWCDLRIDCASSVGVGTREQLTLTVIDNLNLILAHFAVDHRVRVWLASVPQLREEVDCVGPGDRETRDARNVHTFLALCVFVRRVARGCGITRVQGEELNTAALH